MQSTKIPAACAMKNKTTIAIAIKYMTDDN